MEHFVFFPVIVLLALVLVVLSFRLLFRLLLLFIFVLFCWYILSLTGIVSSPREFMKREDLVQPSQPSLLLTSDRENLNSCRGDVLKPIH